MLSFSLDIFLLILLYENYFEWVFLPLLHSLILGHDHNIHVGGYSPCTQAQATSAGQPLIKERNILQST